LAFVVACSLSVILNFAQNLCIFEIVRPKIIAMTFDEAHVVIKRGDIVRMRDELDNGLSPNLSNKYSWTVLMLAAMSGNTPIGRLLIEQGAYLETRNMFKQTALSLAAHTGHPSFVKLLLSSGASLDCDPDGKSVDIFLDWVEKYSGQPKHTIQHTKQLFDEERKNREQSAAS
jgi:ankyrin repeat protein